MYDYGVNNTLEGTGQGLGISERQLFNGILQFNQRCRVGSAQPLSSVDKLTVSSAALRTRSTYRGCRVPPTSLIGSRSRSTYQGRWSRLRFSALAEKKLPFSASACDSRGSTAALCAERGNTKWFLIHIV